MSGRTNTRNWCLSGGYVYTEDAKCLCLGDTMLCPTRSLVGGALGVFFIRQLLGWGGELLPVCWPPGHMLAPVEAQPDERGQFWVPDLTRQSTFKSKDTCPARGSSTVQGVRSPLTPVSLRAGMLGAWSASSRQTSKAQSLKRGRGWGA